MKPHRHLTLGFAPIAPLAASIAVLATFAFAPRADAQGGAPVSIKPVRDNVYFVDAGGGGNAGFIIGKDGVIVVDTTTNSGKQIVDGIAKLTNKPITTVILTHSDIDHVGGLKSFPLGLTIIAHEDNKKDMEATANSPNPSPQDHLPNKTLTKSQSFTINGVKLEVLHFAPAHTSGDLQIYLPAQKIVFTGDVVATSCCGNVRSPQAYTMIKLQKHGSAAGWVQTAKGILALDADIYIPGHGDLQTKSDVQERLARVEARRQAIKEMVAQGKSLEQVKDSSRRKRSCSRLRCLPVPGLHHRRLHRVRKKALIPPAPARWSMITRIEFRKLTDGRWKKFVTFEPLFDEEWVCIRFKDDELLDPAEHRRVEGHLIGGHDPKEICPPGLEENYTYIQATAMVKEMIRNGTVGHNVILVESYIDRAVSEACHLAMRDWDAKSAREGRDSFAPLMPPGFYKYFIEVYQPNLKGAPIMHRGGPLELLRLVKERLRKKFNGRICDPDGKLLDEWEHDLKL